MTGLWGSATLEIVIGLSFIFFLLSLICSSINELLAGLFKLRARHLEQGISNLLCDPGLTQQLLSHPLIKSMGNTRAEAAPVRKLAALSVPGQRSGFPSYIPSRMFALALFDTLLPDKSAPLSVEALRWQALQLAHAADEGRNAIGTALLRVIDAGRDLTPGQAILQVDNLKRSIAQLQATTTSPTQLDIQSAQTVDEIRRVVLDLPAGEVRDRLLNLIASAQVSIESARQSVEVWFDDAMDRVSGVYKRQVQVWLLVIALVVTSLIGADSFQIANSLSRDPALREIVVAQASQAQSPGAPTLGASAFDQLNMLGIPLGYSGAPPLGSSNWWAWLLLKLPGLLVTTFALALGAPFWFDVLQKVSNIRAAGKPPDKPADAK